MSDAIHILLTVVVIKVRNDKKNFALRARPLRTCHIELWHFHSSQIILLSRKFSPKLNELDETVFRKRSVFISSFCPFLKKMLRKMPTLLLLTVLVVLSLLHNTKAEDWNLGLKFRDDDLGGKIIDVDVNIEGNDVTSWLGERREACYVHLQERIRS